MSLSEEDSAKGRRTEKPELLRSSYRRFLIDAHVPDWNDSFLRKVSPPRIADAVALANASVLTVPANNHAGLNFWPSSVGRSHHAVEDRDLLGEMLRAAEDRGLMTVIYYALCYVGWYWDEHPESRFVFADGAARPLKIARVNDAPRFKVVCHNDPGYRSFALTQVRELSRSYASDGFFIDMTMLPGPCYCLHCRERFRRETGHEISTTVDWHDSTWRQFSSSRASWLEEFAGEVAKEIRSNRRSVAIAHQSGGYAGDWWGGASDELAAHTDWLSADLYSTPAALSFGLKLFNSLSTSKPADFLNSWTSPAIFEAIVPRTEGELDYLASIAIAHDAAFTVIDALNPDGSIYESNYAGMTKIFAKVQRLEPFLGGTLVGDVLIYRSLSAALDDTESGRLVEELGYPDEQVSRAASRNAHHHACVEAGVSLQQAHIPYRVVTRKDLDTLPRSSVLIISNLEMITVDEITSIRSFVSDGGRLYLSKSTPEVLAEDALGDILGVKIGEETAEATTYVSPVRDDSLGTSLFSRARPMTVHGRQRLAAVTSESAVVLATLSLPYTPTGDGRYSSILSDPPGRSTPFPSIVHNRYGLGQAIYAAAAIETETHSSQRAIFTELIRVLLGRPSPVTSTGDAAVEITSFERRDLNSLVVFSFNRKSDESSSRVCGFTVVVRTDGRSVASVRSLPDLTPIPFEESDSGFIELDVPSFSVLGVVQIEFTAESNGDPQ